MFKVMAMSFGRYISFNKTYLNFDYALFMFNTAIECEDCESVDIIDATTGEVILSYVRNKGVTTGYNFDWIPIA